jgi:hypothetical protein
MTKLIPGEDFSVNRVFPKIVEYRNGPSNKFRFRATYGNLIVCNIFPA